MLVANVFLRRGVVRFNCVWRENMTSLGRLLCDERCFLRMTSRVEIVMLTKTHAAKDPMLSMMLRRMIASGFSVV